MDWGFQSSGRLEEENETDEDSLSEFVIDTIPASQVISIEALHGSPVLVPELNRLFCCTPASSTSVRKLHLSVMAMANWPRRSED